MSLKLIFMGTPSFALPTLQALIVADYTVCAVYTQPPKPVGRGHRVQKSPIHDYAETENIPIFTPKSLRSAEEQQKFASLQADLAVVAAYGLILPKPILEAPRFGCINVHGSLLPRWRGAAPMQRALLAGDKETGITIMKMDEGLDTGPMLTKAILPLTSKTTMSELHDQMAHLGAKLLIETIPGYIAGTIAPITQPEEGITYADKLSRTDGFIDWQASAEAIERQVRALNPWPGVTFSDGKEWFKVLDVEVIDQHGEPGVVLDQELTIGCGSKAVRLLKIQRSGGKPLDGKAFLNGYSIPLGTRLLCHATN